MSTDFDAWSQSMLDRYGGDDPRPPEGGVREPRRPKNPPLSGGMALEVPEYAGVG